MQTRLGKKNLKKMCKFLKENNSIVLFFLYAILQKRKLQWQISQKTQKKRMKDRTGALICGIK